MKFKVRVEVIEEKELIVEADDYNSVFDKLDTMTDSEIDNQSALLMTSVKIGGAKEI